VSLLDRLPTLATRPAPDLQKPKSRLQETKAIRPLLYVDQRAFLKEVRERDDWHCRRCRREVVVVLARVPERAEVHHVHGKRGELRFLAKAALLLCLECHELVTGRVNVRYVVVGTKFFDLHGQTYIDARFPVRFVRAA
jgi:hypothetical protein